ncbi:D-inositol-3-phosphate glycosyltransferase [Rubritalea halochordaticola]|uniref:D-inositol-3-phosphate glycosyltransferase n=1 Tax=Rubritalea halochordaticola TaxID=714537 RepID=A0ABP9UXB8_9BACT
MRIEFVTDTFPPDVNGVAMTLGRLTSCLKSRGHYIHVIHTGESAACGETKKYSVSLPGYQEVRVGLPSPLKLRKRWKKKRPDAIYVATESPLGVSAIKAAREMGIPVVSGFHTNFHQYLQKYSLGKMQKPAMGYLRRVHSKADCTFAPSQNVVDMLKEEGFEKVKLLGRGVDTNLFNPSKRCAVLRSEWGARAETPVVVIVGRVAPEKNLDFAMDIVREMRARIPDTKAVVVGDGPSREKLAQDNGDVQFVGVKTNEELAKHYASADILLFPSETETFGNVLLEGMASGLITVSYEYAASALHVKHGENGLQARFGDEDSYLEQSIRALGQLRNDQMKDLARQAVLEMSWDKIAQNFEEHIQEVIQEKPVTQRRVKNKRTLKLRSLFLSDIHLGTADSKTREVVQVLKSVRCERIYLNGDIIDGWALKRGSKWRKSHTKVIRLLLKKMEKEGCELIYLRGNHDDFLERILPVDIAGMKVVKECYHEAVNGDRYLVIHGDGFDSVSTNHKWLANLGAVGYDFLLGVNRFYNKYRAWRGKEYFSLSKVVKAKVKSAVSFVDSYEEKLQGLAKAKNCQGIICGHIHTPADKQVGDIHYLNSGDWVETMSCILEHEDGKLEVVTYEDLMKELEIRPNEPIEDEDLEESPMEAIRGTAVARDLVARV